MWIIGLILITWVLYGVILAVMASLEAARDALRRPELHAPPSVYHFLDDDGEEE